MPPVIVAIATEASALAANAAGAFTISSAVIDTVSSLAYSAASIGVTTGALYGIGVALQPRLPGPTSLQNPLKQAMSPRQSATGTARVAGAYALYTTGSTHPNISYDVMAQLDGESDAVVAHYLNDDLMAKTVSGNFWYAPGAPGKYGGGGSNEPNLVKIDTRDGLDTETAYAISSDVLAWTSTHRGDGVSSALLRLTQAKREDQAGDFPNGLATLSTVRRAQKLFDPRDGTQTQGTRSTYKWTDNSWLSLLGYLTDLNGGMGLDWSRFFAPTLSYWESAADEADGLISTSGMHATLLDAAAAGDNKIFLADQTGLTAGTVITLLDGQTVTVSALGMAGEVDLTGTLTNPHAAGELTYWAATGQQARWRANAVYGHDTAPGDVIKGYLQTCDGCLMQRGDGALVPRSNTVYVPTVVFSDRHIVGYQLQDFLPDEQAVNQYIVSYTDPASAFIKAEAGYVEDDIDIADIGPKPQPLDLQWVPSGPQAIAVARAMLARQTQKRRGVLTCNLAGLAAMGERYVGLDVLDPGLATANGIVEVTGKISIDLQNMQVSFPWVAASGIGVSLGNTAVCFALDVSYGLVPNLALAQAGMADILAVISASMASGAVLDLCAIAWGYDAHATTNITKRSADVADAADVEAFVAALTQNDESTDPRDPLNAAKTFFDATDSSITNRILFVITDGDIKPTPAATIAAAAGAIAATMPDVRIYAIRLPEGTSVTPDEVTYMLEYDNTPEDGVPTFTSAPELVARMEQAIFGSSTSSGSSYTVPPLAPPSGSPLQPLAAPTITSVTPVYPNSGGGVAGARLSIVVGDPGGNITWKVQWKLSADSVWTDGGSSITASGTPLTILSGLIPATGSVDVQVAYVTPTQVSPWSATTTTTIAAPIGAMASTSKSASFTTTADKNVYYVDTSSAPVTVTLNANPAANETAEIWDSTGHAGTNPISLAGNGHNIAGVSTVTNAVQINFGKIKVIYSGTQWLAS